MKRTRASVADKPPAKRKSKIINVTEWKSLLDSREITDTILSAVIIIIIIIIINCESR